MTADNEQRTTVTIHGGENILDELQNVLDNLVSYWSKHRPDLLRRLTRLCADL